MRSTYAAAVWGPHYWFFLHTVAATYPDTPNDTTKKKYYELVSNFPLWIPNAAMGNRFARMLDEFPVAPYLGSRDSFVKWVFFMHNKYNDYLQKESPTFEEAQSAYEERFEHGVLLALKRPKSTKEMSPLERFAFWWNHESPRQSLFFAALLSLILFALFASWWFQKLH